MAAMDTLQIRLPRQLVRDIDRDVRRGVYRSRSDAIRMKLERQELLSIFRELQGVFEEEGMNKNELSVALKEARNALYKRYL